MEKNQQILSVYRSSSERIDHYLSQLFQWSRSEVKALIKANMVTCNQRLVKPAHLVSTGDEIFVKMPDKLEKTVPIATVSNDTINTHDWMIPIIYSDDHLLIVNKPAGLIVHDAPTLSEPSLVDILIAAKIPLFSDDLDRPGIVHRLDQFTEGLLILVKSAASFNGLRQQFKDRQVKKHYYTVLQGVLTDKEGVIDRPIGRDKRVRARQSCHHYVDGTEKSALTRFNVLHQFTNLSFVHVDLVTGRTHQIRVHFSALNCPVLGDFLYSKQSKKAEGYYLQSYYLEFKHPVTNDIMKFKLPISDRLKKYAK